MAKEKYFPFRSVSGDRKYSAEDWAAYFALFLSDGVFYSSADKLKVVEYSGMKVKVKKGAGFIGGRMYILDTDKVITLDTADGALSRIDRIVLRCDYSNRLISAEVVKGSYSEVPTAPELTRNADVYELALADVYVAAGVITITTANITDQRLNTSLCGTVTGLVEQADTTEIFNQFQGYLQEFKQTSEAEYTEWLEGLKDILAEDVAGNLLVKIEDVEDSVTELRKEIEEKPAGDTATVRYVSAETDEDFDWIQVQDAEGNWVNAYRAYTQRYELYVDQNNGAEFTPYACCTPTGAYATETYIAEADIVLDDKMTIWGTMKPGGITHCSVISKLIDLTRFKTLKLYHSSEVVGQPANAGENHKVELFITQAKTPIIRPTVLEALMISKPSNEGEVSIDISSLNGEYYIGFCVSRFGSYDTKTIISNMYME